MKVSAHWFGQEKIRVTLTLTPGELHPKVGNPIEVEEWLRTLLESRDPVVVRKVAKVTP